MGLIEELNKLVEFEKDATLAPWTALRNILPELLECAKALAELDPLGRETAAKLNVRESMIAWAQARAHGREAISALQKKLTGADGEDQPK